MKFTLLIALWSFLLVGFVAAQKPAAATGTNVLKKELQLRLDEWHKAGKFPGATLGVALLMFAVGLNLSGVFSIGRYLKT